MCDDLNLRKCSYTITFEIPYNLNLTQQPFFYVNAFTISAQQKIKPLPSDI